MTYGKLWSWSVLTQHFAQTNSPVSLFCQLIKRPLHARLHLSICRNHNVIINRHFRHTTMYPDSGYKLMHTQLLCTRPSFRPGDDVSWYTHMSSYNIPCSAVDEWLVVFPSSWCHTQRFKDMIFHVVEELFVGDLLYDSAYQCPPVSGVVVLWAWIAKMVVRKYMYIYIYHTIPHVPK